MYTIHRRDQDGHWQQFGTTPILISAPQWSHMHCNGLMQLDRVGKKLSVKADLVIYSHVADISGQRITVSLILGFKLDFSSSAIWDGCCKSSHIYKVQWGLI